jgi:uncharacterized membrane protein YjgN (DUF898 family)
VLPGSGTVDVLPVPGSVVLVVVSVAVSDGPVVVVAVVSVPVVSGVELALLWGIVMPLPEVRFSLVLTKLTKPQPDSSNKLAAKMQAVIKIVLLPILSMLNLAVFAGLVSSGYHQINRKIWDLMAPLD